MINGVSLHEGPALGHITEQEEKVKTELAATRPTSTSGKRFLTIAIQLAGSCHAAYLKANPKERSRFNDAVLKAVYLEDGMSSAPTSPTSSRLSFPRPSSNKWVKVPLIQPLSNSDWLKGLSELTNY
jgi:hypothetical protein